ncbi:MAG: heat-shock protein Hsp20 [Candidatus Amoebophilus sp. 36-38]|nr:MAG: heat-shock protein Hsp20 [Candidatus Amoebophilus sp. 36-38]
MTLMKVDQSLFPRFSNLWEDFLGKDVMDMPNWKVGASIPAVNIVEKTDKFLVHLASPGMNRNDFKINVDNGVLTVASEKKEEHEEKDKESRFTRREFSYQSFKRSFTLPESVQADKIEAKYENGILEIILPKHETAQVKPIKQIQVK